MKQKINLLLLIITLGITSCKKEGPTNVSGYVYDENGEKLSDFHFRVSGGCGKLCKSDKEVAKNIIVTDANGFYNVTFEAKDLNGYGFYDEASSFTFDQIKNGEKQTRNIYVKNIQSTITISSKRSFTNVNSLIYSLYNNDSLYFQDTIPELTGINLWPFKEVISYKKNINKFKYKLFDNKTLIRDTIFSFKLLNSIFTDTVYI